MRQEYKMTPAVATLTRSRKKHFVVSDGYTTICTNSYWDGGSRDQYEVLNINTGQRFVPPTGNYPWTTPNEYTLQAGDIVINTGHFCGKPSTPRLCVRTDDLDRVLAYLHLDQVAMAV